MDTHVPLKSYDKTVAGLFLIVILVIVAGVGYGIFELLPVLLKMAEDIVYLGLELFAMLAIVAILAQLWMSRDAVVLKFKMNARNVRKRFIADDPIGAIDASIHSFNEKLTDIDAKSVEANAAYLRFKNRVRNREKTGMLDMADKEDAMANAAESLKRPDNEVSQHAVAAERWRNAAASVQPMIEDQAFIKGKLEEARQLAGDALHDMENQRVVLAAQYDAYKDSQAQITAFRAFFGKSEALQTIDFAVEAIEKKTTDVQADIDQLMHQLTPRIAAAQLAHEAEAAAALQHRAEAKQLAEAKPVDLPVARVKDALPVSK